MYNYKYGNSWSRLGSKARSVFQVKMAPLPRDVDAFFNLCRMKSQRCDLIYNIFSIGLAGYSSQRLCASEDGMLADRQCN